MEKDQKEARAAARYEALMDMCRGGFGDGAYDASYHALAAALHCAVDLADAGRMEGVAALADAQMREIDRGAPGYHHSTASSARRSNESVLSVLSRQARAHILLASSQRLLAGRRRDEGAPWRGDKGGGDHGER